MSFPCYANYKDSGVEWLGQVSAVSRFDVPMFTYGDGCGG
jgi:hypothetical protein